MDVPVKRPSGSGPYRISGHDEDGSVLFSFRFAPRRTDHGEAAFFVFAIPFEDAWSGGLDRITLSGPEGSTTVNRQAIDRAAVIVDPGQRPRPQHREGVASRVARRDGPRGRT